MIQTCSYAHSGTTPAHTISGTSQGREVFGARTTAHTNGTTAMNASGHHPSGGNAHAISTAWSKPAMKGGASVRTSGLLARIVDDPGDLAPQVLPLHDPVDQASGEQELGPLEALGELL